MFIDINTYIGHWPFRNLQYNTLEGLDELASQYDITHMVVSNINGFFYKDANMANLELLEALEAYKGTTKFLALAIVNPNYICWEDDARDMIAKGFAGFEIAPLYHRYGLPKEDGARDFSLARKVFALAEELGVPVRICASVENYRGRNENDTYLDITANDCMQLLSYNKSVPVFLTGFNPFACNETLRNLLKERKNTYFDTTQFEAFNMRDGQNAVYRYIAKEQLCFGSMSPFNYMEVALLRTKLAPGADFELYKTNPKSVFKALN